MNSSKDLELTDALLAHPASLPPKLFYDRLGSTLFTAICEVPEYYPTRTEAAIFRAHRAQIASLLPADIAMIDLGAGDCRKAAALFSAINPARYIAVDISGDYLDQAVSSLRREYADIDMQAVVRDFTQPWSLPNDIDLGNSVYFYPGSSIGNFTPELAAEFISNLRSQGGQGSASPYLLIGVDLIKDAAVLEAAYDDPLGVTAAFNRNMLLHFNRLVGADFDLADWSHRALFNAQHSRIEMHLVAGRDLTVSWPGGQRDFTWGEGILTECSYKYTPDSFAQLLNQSGFTVRGQWTDTDQKFMVMLAQAQA